MDETIVTNVDDNESELEELFKIICEELKLPKETIKYDHSKIVKECDQILNDLSDLIKKDNEDYYLVEKVYLKLYQLGVAIGGDITLKDFEDINEKSQNIANLFDQNFSKFKYFFTQLSLLCNWTEETIKILQLRSGFEFLCDHFNHLNITHPINKEYQIYDLTYDLRRLDVNEFDDKLKNWKNCYIRLEDLPRYVPENHFWWLPKSDNIFPYISERNGFYKTEFREIGEIGRGSYAKVLEVENKKQRFAIKKIRLNDEISKIGLSELKNFKDIGKLRHGNVIKYCDLWLENENDHNLTYAFIQIELCDFTLKDLMQDMSKYNLLVTNNCLTLLGYYISCQLFTQILEGVNYLHQQNPQIIHRNINPTDILLKISEDRKNIVKISDFGIACLHKYKYQRHTQDIGRLSYAAPEVLDSNSYDTRADIYSLGVVLNELFLIENQSDYEGIREISLLVKKYQELQKLCGKMTDINIRPNCQQILADKELWTLNDNQFDAKILLEEFNQKCYDKTRFTAKLFDKFYSSLNEEQHLKHLNIKDIINELRKTELFEKYTKKFDEIENSPNYEILRYIHKDIINKENKLEMRQFVQTLLSSEQLINVDKIVEFFFGNEEESEEIKIKKDTKEMKINAILNKINDDYKALLISFILTGQNNAALILDPNAIDLTDLSHSGPSKSHVIIEQSSEAHVTVNPSKAEKKGSLYYQMNKNPRGKCIIINNEPNITKESKRFKSIFKQLHFNVELLYCMSAEKIRKKLQTYAKDKTREKADAFIVMIIGHGEDESILGYNESQSEDKTDVISFKDIVDLFSEKNCSSLFHVPKLFFFNCYKKVTTDSVDITLTEDEKQMKLNTIDQNWLNKNKDTFISYSCSEGYENFYNPHLGLTAFGQALSYSMAQYACEESLESIISRADDFMDTWSISKPKMRRQFMRRQLYFNPGIYK